MTTETFGSTKAEWLESFRVQLKNPLEALLLIEKHCLMRYADTMDHDYIDVGEELAQVINHIVGAISTIHQITTQEKATVPDFTTPIEQQVQP